jgi:hypothetical protein
MDACPVCGALYALVGRTHRCASNIAAPVINMPVVKHDVKQTPAVKQRRDPEKWRTYMRGYMKRRRAK